MVGQSGTSVLFVSGHSDSTQYRTLFYGADVFGGKNQQCAVSVLRVLCSNGPVGKLRQDFLDSISVPILRGFPVSAALSFGQSIIAVDMFLNLVTTNSSEALELLDNLIPAIVLVVVLYIPALVLATVSMIRKRKLPESFLRRERKRSWIALAIGILSLGSAFWLDNRYELKSDLYPANVCYNIALAFQRTARTQNYGETSKDFTFNARATHSADRKEAYIMVVGETSRAANWSIYGYGRETNPELSKVGGLTAFGHVLTESNTTHKSVPMLLSAVNANDFDSIYHQKGIITAFKEAGYRTAFFPISDTTIPSSIFWQGGRYL